MELLTVLLEPIWRFNGSSRVDSDPATASARARLPTCDDGGGGLVAVGDHDPYLRSWAGFRQEVAVVGALLIGYARVSTEEQDLTAQREG